MMTNEIHFDDGVAYESGSGLEQAKVELKRLRLHDANGLKVWVVRVQKVPR
jgi:hypothetical protein